MAETDQDGLKALPEWRYDESIPVARDFTSAEEVQAYDGFHRRFRDVEADTARAVELLAPRPGDVVADFGCGTGRLVRRLAPLCATVHAIDLSGAMLDFAARLAREEGLANIEFHHATFLTYEHGGAPLDAAHSALALHHLPDFWKQVALRRIHAALRPGGRFVLTDISWPDERPLEAIDAWLDALSARDPEIGRALAETPRREFATTAWILRAILERAGFAVERVIEGAGRVIHTFVCRAWGVASG